MITWQTSTTHGIIDPRIKKNFWFDLPPREHFKDRDEMMKYHNSAYIKKEIRLFEKFSEIYDDIKIAPKKGLIIETKKEMINLIKAKNVIDIRTPFFLNVKLNLDKTNNLVKLNSRIKKIDSIEKLYVQEFNKDIVKLRIKYLGNLQKIINQLKTENIELKLINDQWIIKKLN